MNIASAIRACGDLAVILVFSGICCSHFAFGADHGRDGAHKESRTPASFPAEPADLAGVDAWLRGLEDWFDDHFAFRPQLQALEAGIRTRVFGVSPSEQVVLGKGGWLYYTKDGIFPDRRGDVILGETDLEDWRKSLEQRQQALAKFQVPYLFCVAPNKVTVHPEKLPDRHLAVSGRPTRLDQILLHLETKSDFHILDGRPVLKRVAASRQTYHATDSHWNEVGAFAFYEAMIHELNKRGMNIEPVDSLNFTPMQWPFTGDLGLLVPWLETPQEQGWFMTPAKASPATQATLGFDQKALQPSWNVWDPPAVWTCKEGKGTLLFLGDSFQWPLQQWLARHFESSCFLSISVRDFETFQSIIEFTKPTVVIEQRAERNMAWTLKPKD